MSAERDLGTRTIYVELLDDGTYVRIPFLQQRRYSLAAPGFQVY